MATWTWLWRHTTRVKGRLTRHKVFRRSAKRGTTCKRYRMPISGLARGVLPMHLSIDTRSTETSLRKAASYSAMNRKSSAVGDELFIVTGWRLVGGARNLKLTWKFASGFRALAIGTW